MHSYSSRQGFTSKLSWEAYFFFTKQAHLEPFRSCVLHLCLTPMTAECHLPVINILFSKSFIFVLFFSLHSNRNLLSLLSRLHRRQASSASLFSTFLNALYKDLCQNENARVDGRKGYVQRNCLYVCQQEKIHLDMNILPNRLVCRIGCVIIRSTILEKGLRRKINKMKASFCCLYTDNVYLGLASSCWVGKIFLNLRTNLKILQDKSFLQFVQIHV